MRRKLRVVFAGLVAAVWAATGCRSPQTAVRGANSRQEAVRNNCYSLLYQLLQNEKDVNLLHFVKSENPALRDLVKHIAIDSKAGAELLERVAKKDPSLRLDDFNLPLGEVATRDAIALTERKNLLSQKTNSFELTLLLTQSDALQYGWHLALVASRNTTDAEERRALVDLSFDLETLYQKVFSLLLANGYRTGETAP